MKKIFMIIGTMILILISLASIQIFRNRYRSDTSVNLSANRSVRDLDHKEVITITKRRSPTIINRGEFKAWPVGDNVPFIYHYNGGEGNGGWDDVVPPRSEFKRLGFKPRFHLEKIVTISFSLQSNAPIESAEIVYSNKELE